MSESTSASAAGLSASRPAEPPAPADGRRIDLIALDLDGTALRSDKQLTRGTAEAVRRCAERGIHVVLASARPPRAVRQIHERLALDTLSIHYNGALIHNFATGRNVEHRPMEADLARRIVSAARRAHRQCLVSVEILDKWYTDRHDPHLSLEVARHFRPDFIGPIDAFLRVPVTKLMLLAEPRKLGKVRRVIEKRFRGRVALAVSDDHVIQLMRPGVDKAAAVQRVAERYGIARDNVMAVGDAPNDAGMLRWAGLGVAVASAWPELHPVADAVVPANDEDGAAHALRRYALGEG